MTAAPLSTPSPVPVRPKQKEEQSDPASHDSGDTSSKPPIQPKPKLRLHVEDLRHSGAASFLSLLPDVGAVLNTALAAIIEHLYTSHPTSHSPRNAPPPPFIPALPGTRSVTVILKDFDGVAYTNGIDLDDDHKEISFSLSYIRYVCDSNPDPISELTGVLTHELVHCYQHSTPFGSGGGDIPHPPGGLVEGIADFIRLKAGLVPGHWKQPESAKDRASKWDEGYQHTAFFLAWLEDVRIGRGAIGLLNDRLLRTGYIGESKKDEGNSTRPSFWKDLFGAHVSELWDEYGRFLDHDTT
jgi:hypothetical protein